MIDRIYTELGNIDRRLSQRQKAITKSLLLTATGVALTVIGFSSSVESSAEANKEANLRNPSYNPSAISTDREIVNNFPSRLHEVIEAGQAENISEYINIPKLDEAYQNTEAERIRLRDFNDLTFPLFLRFIAMEVLGLTTMGAGVKEAIVNRRLILLGRKNPNADSKTVQA